MINLKSQNHDAAIADLRSGEACCARGGASILIVEDRSAERENLAAILEYGGYRLLEAANGAEALELVRRGLPDLVITDIMMPKMDGYELIRQIRARPETAATRVIIYTATYRQREAKMLAEAAGAVRFITKPLDPEDMLALVKTALEEKPLPNSSSLSPAEIESAHLRLITDKLMEKAAQLEKEIAGRHQTEETLRDQSQLLDLAQDAIIVRHLDRGVITYWNKGAERLYGWTAATALEHDICDLLFLDPSVKQQCLDKVLASGEWHGELQQVCKDGREIIVNARASLVRDADGKPHSVFIINTDVTEQKKLESRFLRAQRLESVGSLASGVAHDLNNILAPILMAVPMLRLNMVPKQQDKLLDMIESSAQRGADIVKQVLTFGRGLEGVRLPLQPGRLIREMEMLAIQTFPKSITIRNSAPGDLWAVTGDSTQFHQVLLNLCINARDAMPDGGTLHLTAENFTIDEHYAAMRPEANAGPYVILKVSDSGHGIPAEIIDKIFDPFFTTKAPGKGTGLGLSTVLGIVKSHGGFMDVFSDSGSGTMFNVFLPASIEGTAQAVASAS